MEVKARWVVVLLFALLLSIASGFMTGPILAPMLMDMHSTMLPQTATLGYRTYVVAGIMACYGFGQFLGGPIIGELSDQFGRRRVLQWSLLLALCGFLLSAVAIHTHHLSLFVFSRFLTGFSAGMAAVVLAALSNFSPQHSKRRRYMGYITAASALGAATGGLIGGWFSDPEWLGFLSFNTPFLIFSGLTVFAWLLLLLFDDRGNYQRRKLNFFVGFRNIKQAMQIKPLRTMLLYYLCFCMSIEAFFVSFPISVVERFSLGPASIGNYMMAGSIVSLFSGIWFNRWLSRRVKVLTVAICSMLVLGLSYVFFAFVPHPNWIYLALCGIAVVDVLIWAASYTLLGNMVAPEVRGKLFGVTGSLLSLASLFGSLAVAHLAALHYLWVLAFCLSMLALAVVLLLNETYKSTCDYR